MCKPWFDCDSFQAGRVHEVVAVRTAAARTPARLFINGLDRTEYIDCWTNIEWVAENGEHAGRCRQERGKLRAIDGPGLVRLPYYSRGRMLIITHGFKKPGQRWPGREYERAERLIALHDQQVAHEVDEA